MTRFASKTTKRRRRAFLLAGFGVALTMVITTAHQSVSSGAVAASVQPCSSGLIAMTFDDGPNPTLTPQFIDVLLEKRVPATFFVVGERAAAYPDIVRRAYRSGFKIGNHTWSHEHLPTLTDSQIADSLTRTQEAIQDLGAAPSGLMRPPWGDTNDRVLAVIQSLGLTQVLWNAGYKEASPSTSADIVNGVLADLSPGGSYIALMHDGWATESLIALPVLIDKARALGYCFGSLGAKGQVLPPVPMVNVGDARVYERNAGRVSYLRFPVTLSEPTSRATSVLVRTAPGTAEPYADYVPRVLRIQFPVGVTRLVVRVRVRGDNRPERTETVMLRASEPDGLRLGDRIGVGRIIDND